MNSTLTQSFNLQGKHISTISQLLHPKSKENVKISRIFQNERIINKNQNVLKSHCDKVKLSIKFWLIPLQRNLQKSVEYYDATRRNDSISVQDLSPRISFSKEPKKVVNIHMEQLMKYRNKLGTPVIYHRPRFNHSNKRKQNLRYNNYTQRG